VVRNPPITEDNVLDIGTLLLNEVQKIIQQLHIYILKKKKKKKRLRKAEKRY